MNTPTNNPKQTPTNPSKNLSDADLIKAFAHPQDQYTCSNLNNKEIAIAFLEGFLNEYEYFPSLDLPKLKVEQRDMHDSVVFKDSYADIHYTIPLKNAPNETSHVVVLAEHKSKSERWAIVQLVHYSVIELYQSSPLYKSSKTQAESSPQKRKNEKQLLPPIIPIIIYNGEKQYSGPRCLSDLYQPVDGLKEPFLDFKPIIIDLSTIPFDNLPNNPNEWRLNVVLRALKSGMMENLDFKEVEKNFEFMLERYDPNNPVDVQFIKQTVLYYLSGSHVNSGQLYSYIQDNYPVPDDGVKNMTLTVAEQFVQQGIERGDKQGFERGIEQGIEQGIESSQKTLLKMLRTKFKTVPMLIQKQIKLIHNKVFLDSLFIEVLVCQTMDEFSRKLQLR